MTEQKQAMEQALAALENSEPLHEGVGWRKKHFAAKDALRSALSSLPDVQTVREPKAYLFEDKSSGYTRLYYTDEAGCSSFEADLLCSQQYPLQSMTPLYAAASAPKEPGRTDGAALPVTKAQHNRMMHAAEPYRNCEFCGCHTNAKVRACCKKGRVADACDGWKHG
jgi:hypothetical protein